MMPDQALGVRLMLLRLEKIEAEQRKAARELILRKLPRDHLKNNYKRKSE